MGTYNTPRAYILAKSKETSHITHPEYMFSKIKKCHKSVSLKYKKGLMKGRGSNMRFALWDQTAIRPVY